MVVEWWHGGGVVAWWWSGGMVVEWWHGGGVVAWWWGGCTVLEGPLFHRVLPAQQLRAVLHQLLQRETATILQQQDSQRGLCLRSLLFCSLLLTI